MYSCTICGATTVRISPLTKLGASGFSWEHDSTMQLLGMHEADCALRLCPNCMHSIIFPVFDTDRLYAEDGVKIRSEVYKKYFPGDAYGQAVGNRLDLAALFTRASMDFKRFSEVSAFVGKRIGAEFQGVDELRILDWGGGDGYISSLYASVLQGITGLKTTSVVYDLAEWKEVGNNKAEATDLDRMPKFHVVILSGILEHTHEHSETLRKAVRYLHEGGIVICEVPDERYTMVNALLRRQRFGLHYHVCSFSGRSLHMVLEDAGLKNVSVVLQAGSSYRGKPIRFFVGIGQKTVGEDEGQGAPGRLKTCASIAAYFLHMATGKVSRMLKRVLRSSVPDK